MIAVLARLQMNRTLILLLFLGSGQWGGAEAALAGLGGIAGLGLAA